MKLTIIKKIGKTSYPFQFEGKDLFECLIESKKLAFYDVPKCGVCGGDDIRLDAYITKDRGYKYAVIRCKCGAKATFGQPKKEPDTFYIRKDDKGIIWENPKKIQSSLPEDEQEIAIEDIPF